MEHDSTSRSRVPLPLWLLLGAGVVVLALLLGYRPDRPLPALVPGSSDGPAFVVQIIRPRAGLPLGGLVPPQLLGQDARLGFSSEDPGAQAATPAPGRFEFRGAHGAMALVLDGAGHPTAGTWVEFDLVFEERQRRVRGRPGDPVVGSAQVVTLPGGGGRAGTFEVELARCEDVATGEPLGWPPQPLRLRGSFDRIP